MPSLQVPLRQRQLRFRPPLLGRVFAPAAHSLSRNEAVQKLYLGAPASSLSRRLDFVPDLIGLERLRPAAELEMAAEATEPGPDVLALSSYFRLKRFLDVLAAAAIIILISPIWLVVGAITLLDIATPIFFWQQRLGQGGRPFLL